MLRRLGKGIDDRRTWAINKDTKEALVACFSVLIAIYVCNLLWLFPTFADDLLVVGELDQLVVIGTDLGYDLIVEDMYFGEILL